MKYNYSLLWLFIVLLPAFGRSQQSEPLEKETRHRQKIILWMNTSALGFIAGEDNGQSGGRYQFGVEFCIKNNPSIRLSAWFLPIYIGSSNRVYQDGSINGEVALLGKKFFTNGKTAFARKMYWGAEMRYGREKYDSESLSSGTLETTKTTWDQIFGCLGYQATKKIFAFDIMLPIGFQHYAEHRYSASKSKFVTNQGFVIRPGVSLGLRF